MMMRLGGEKRQREFSPEAATYGKELTTSWVVEAGQPPPKKIKTCADAQRFPGLDPLQWDEVQIVALLGCGTFGSTHLAQHRG